MSHPIPVPHGAWSDVLERPGYEFDVRGRPIRPPRDHQDPRDYQGPRPIRPPAPPGPVLEPPPARTVEGRIVPSRSNARARRPGTERADHRADHRVATAEWARLLRTFVPQPAQRSWFREFRQALVFRGWGLRVGIPIIAMMVFGVAVVVIAQANSGASGPAPAATSLGFPPATLAGGQFAAAEDGRGISQTLGRVASDGNEIVAVGAQAGARIPRAQFFVSPDGGTTWTMGAVRAPGGSPPPPGHAARYVAGGRGAWVALGRDAIWTSNDGRTWTLSSATGLPLLPGDQVDVLKRTAAGFIAAGTNTRAKSPVVFLSSDGITWRRTQPHLSGARDIRFAAATGNLILIAGDMATTGGGAWLSKDGGVSWTPVRLPAGHGALPRITGAAALGNGFILVRSAQGGKTDVYRSPDGTAWTFAAALTTNAGFAADMTNGGPVGAVIEGQTGTKALTAFVSANGTSWGQTATFGSAASESVSGVTLIPAGAVVTGTTAPQPAVRLPLITLVPPRGHPEPVDIARIPNASDPQLTLNALAAADGTQVAVGSANGFPAAWSSVNGGSTWTRAVGQPPAVLGRPGVQELTGVTHGTAGWLAVGGVIAVAAEHPVVLVSADGHTWSAADGQTAFSGPGLVTRQTAAGQAGYVIVGSQNNTSAAAWWSATPAAPGAFQRARVATADAQMLAVTAGPDGFVAVGSHGGHASVWTSRDGRNWNQQDLADAVLRYVTSYGRTVVAMGTTPAGLPAVAVSADGGATWHQSTLPVPVGQGVQATVTALAATGRGFTATGAYGSSAGHQDVVVWTSATGSQWKAVTPTGQGLTGSGIQAITALAASGSTMTGVGFIASPAGEQPTFWQSPIR